jgi:hypothetical protein
MGEQPPVFGPVCSKLSAVVSNRQRLRNANAITMHYLTFDASDDADGITTLEAVAATSADRHGAVLAEAQQVLDWAWRQFPHSHGPIDEGHDWDHDLQVTAEGEGGRWQVLTLTLAASPRFAEAFQGEFGASD